MSNDVINMDAFKAARPAAAFASLNPQEESLADGIGSSYAILNYKGKVWGLRHRGEKHQFNRPDDGSPMSYIDVIILRQARAKSKTYYEGGYSMEQSEGKRPTCSSIDGTVPDQDVTAKQSDACAICPRNVWKQDSTGRKSRECSDFKRLAVLLLPTLSKRVLGDALMEPVFLRIPAGSLNDLATYGETMAKQGWHFSSVVTRISFDPNVAHPKMTFRPIQALTDDEAPVVLPLRDGDQAKRIVGEDTRPVSNSLRLAGATVSTVGTTDKDGPASVATGFAAVQPVSKPVERPPAATQTVIDATATVINDTGEASDADDELDRRLADLLKTA